MKPILIILTTIFCMTTTINSQGQNALPYSEIPQSPQSYTAGNVASRMIDGLGFRYYWATEGLTEADLSYKPSKDARNLAETLDHIYGLSLTIANAPRKLVNERPADWSHMSFEEKRGQTLENLKISSDILKASQDQDLESYQVIFKRGENQSEFPFWNLLNGPLADAIWHTGQVVLMRRSAGNPINPKVNVFMGKLNK